MSAPPKPLFGLASLSHLATAGLPGPQTGMPWQHPITTAAGRKPGLGWGEWSSFLLCDQPRGDVNVNVKVGLLSSWDLSSLFTWWCLTSLKGAGGLEEIWRKTTHDYEQNKSIGERKVMWDRGTWRRATTEGTYHNGCLTIEMKCRHLAHLPLLRASDGDHTHTLREKQPVPGTSVAFSGRCSPPLPLFLWVISQCVVPESIAKFFGS